MADKEWQRRQDVIEGKRRDHDVDTNVASTDHTESRDDTSAGGGEGTQTQAEPDEKTAVQGDGPHGESI